MILLCSNHDSCKYTFRIDGWGIEARLSEARGSCLLHSLHTASGAYLASYTMDTWILFTLRACEAGHSTQPSAELQNGRAVSTTPSIFMAWQFIRHKTKFIFIFLTSLLCYVFVTPWLSKTSAFWLSLNTSGQNVRSEVFTAVTMKNGVFWDVTPCGSCKNRRFEGT
jgi:hypothetical protein